MLNLDNIKNSTLHKDPYPYMIVDEAVCSEFSKSIIQDLPTITVPGSVPSAQIEQESYFGKLLLALEADDFRNVLSEKFDLDLEGYPVSTTIRGLMRKKDGRIHTDSKTKVMTILLYLNESWTQDAGRLRILNNGSDMNDYVAEIPPLFGKMVVFQVTDNCWHGHTPLEGKRMSLQMNYVTSSKALNKHKFFHTLSAKLKHWLQ